MNRNTYICNCSHLSHVHDDILTWECFQNYSPFVKESISHGGFASHRLSHMKIWCFLVANTLRQKQNGRHFPDDIFKCIFLNEQGKSEGFDSCDWPIVRKRPLLGQNRWYFVPCDLEIWRMTLKNNRAPLLWYFKLYASFRSHRWIQAGVTVRKRPIWVKIDNFFSRVTLQFDIWPWKTIGHLFYATSSFVHHFVAIGDFKLELQSGNAQFGSNSTILEPCDLEIWCMTFKNNRAPFLF